MPPLLETLPAKHSEDPSVRRRIVYLDQNVVSSIAKARLNRDMDPSYGAATRELYAAIQVAVRDRQDALCIESFFHREESSGLVVMAGEKRKDRAKLLFDEIAEFIQYYSYGLHLTTCSEILQTQTLLAVARQLGVQGDQHRRHNWRAALSRNPHSSHDRDGRLVEFGEHKFVLGVQWDPQAVVVKPWASLVTKLRTEGAYVDRTATMERMKTLQRSDAVKANEWNSWGRRWNVLEPLPREAVDRFIQSDEFFELPINFAMRHLCTHLLSERDRAFQDSDTNDIEILSSSIPYSDLVITDRYMAGIVAQCGLDAAFGTTVLPATTDGLRRAAAILNEPARPNGAAPDDLDDFEDSRDNEDDP